jgi:nucleoside-diphosphate-sugar epimerase
MPVVAAGHICEKLCKPFGITPPIFPRRVDWYRQNRAFDISRAKRELGYVPRVELDEGLRRTGRWYREQGYLKEASGKLVQVSAA